MERFAAYCYCPVFSLLNCLLKCFTEACNHVLRFSLVHSACHFPVLIISGGTWQTTGKIACLFSLAHLLLTLVAQKSWSRETMHFKHVAEGMLAKLTVPAIQHLWFLKLWFGCRFSFFCWTCSLSFLGLILEFALNQRCWHQLELPISSILFIWLAAFASPEHLQMKAVELNLCGSSDLPGPLAHGWYSNIFQQRPGHVFDG